MKTFTPFLVTAAVFLAAPALAQDAGQTAADSNMEILKQKVKADKKLVVAGNMELTDAEAQKFWPLYDAYQKELDTINEHLAQTIRAYADAFNQGPIENDTAEKLLKEALSAQEAEIKLKRSYADKMSEVLPATKTARYIQIENKIRAALDAELASQIPLIY